jgi:hypothetical protein
MSAGEYVRGTYADGYAKGAPILDDNNQPTSEMGTGKGCQCGAFLSPEDWEYKDSTDGPGFEPDEVLFHELIHVTRQFRGRQSGIQVDGGGYGNEEEYLATVLANLYLSEKGKSLRGRYGDLPKKTREVKVQGETILWVIDPPPKHWSVMKDPDKFYQNPDGVRPSPRQLMEHFRNTQKT